MNSELPSPMEFDVAQPGDVGDLLRASRLRQGQELTDVARALRIRTVYLQAIEDGHYDDLPGTVYAIGFIRSYAEHLGLDGEQLVNRFKADAQGQGRKTKLVFPVAVSEHGMPRGAVVTIGALILIAAYGGWYFLSTKDIYVTDLIPPVPQSIMRAFDTTRDVSAPVVEVRRAEPTAAVAAPVQEAKPPAPMPAQTATAQPTETATLQPPTAAAPAPASEPVVTAPVVTPAPAPVPAPPPVPAVLAPEPAPAAPAPSANAAPAASAAPAAAPDPEPAEAAAADEEEPDSTPAPTAAVPSTASDPSPAAMLDDRGGADAPAAGSQLASLPGVGDPSREIVLTAVVDCWIEIRDTVANQKLLSRLLRKGDRYSVPAREGLALVAGNAGGLEIAVGGDTVPSLGPLGVVRRNVALDPTRLKAGTAVVE